MKINLDPLRDAQEEHPAAWCEGCRMEVYAGEQRYLWEGRWLCHECLCAQVERLLRENPGQLALELGLEIERCG